MSKDRILKNLARQLVRHGKIKTTESRAKKLREIVGGKNGFVKIVKLGARLGDNAPMAMIEFIKIEPEKGKPVVTKPVNRKRITKK